jgi:hypothetical protein
MAKQVEEPMTRFTSDEAREVRAYLRCPKLYTLSLHTAAKVEQILVEVLALKPEPRR